jgi:AraC-like DNA-binding protein
LPFRETWQKLLSAGTYNRDPLATALVRKALAGKAGATEGRTVAAGEGWRVSDIVCTSGPCDRPFEEHFSSASISIVLSGTFGYRSDRGSWLLAPGVMLLGNAGHAFECSHPYGEGDRCISFQYEAGLLERVAYDAGAKLTAFDRHCIPPLRELAAMTARATMAMTKTIGRSDSFEEISLELAGAVIEVAGRTRREEASISARDSARIARVLRQLESSIVEPHTLADLARDAGLSRYHFLRTFKSVTGITPHQWLLRARLRHAAQRLATSRHPVTEIAFDVGFEDLSNFIRSFRGEFGVSPSRYRAGDAFRS